MKDDMNNASQIIIPPKPEKKTVEHQAHGDVRTDHYDWMRAHNWAKAIKNTSLFPDEIRLTIDAENAYHAKITADTKPLQDELYQEFIGRIEEDNESVPSKDGPYEYWWKIEQGQDYPTYMRKEIATGEVTVVFDQNKEKQAFGTKFFDLGDIEISDDHKIMAYGLDTSGSELYDIRFRDLETGEDFGGVIPETNGSGVWSKDGSRFYYIEREENRPKRIKCHILGTDPQEDRIVFENEDTGLFLGLDRTLSGDYILITRSNSESSETYLLEADADDHAVPGIVSPLRDGHEYNIDHRGDYFYITTNKDDAVNFKVMRAPVSDPREENWEEIIAHRPDVEIAGLSCKQNYMIRTERHNALPRVIVSDYDGNEKTIAFEDEAYAIGTSIGPEFESNKIRITYETPAKPSEKWEIDLNDTNQRKLLKTQKIPSGHNPDDYIVERFTIEARDGTQVPITTLRHKSTKKDGSAPLFLYGYGSYGISMPASFSTTRLSVADRGGIYAVAHIRGGGDMGQQWHKDAKFENKPNTFNDFVDSARALNAMGYGKRGTNIIHGGSAGGLLVGASVNQDPELYGGVIANVPFVDVLNTIMDPSLPLTPPEWDEWGNPIESPEIYNVMKGYCPYTNINQGEAKGKTYPPVLALTAASDYRVTYWEPLKWIAKLRDQAKGGPFMMKTNMEAGHGGASGRYEAFREAAEYYAFAINRFKELGYDMSLRPLTGKPAQKAAPAAYIKKV